MLTIEQLLANETFPDFQDISLSLYKDFSKNILLKRKFTYTLTDDSKIAVRFTDYGIYHMLGIQHIDNSIKSCDFLREIDNGLSFDSLKLSSKKRKRFKNMKPRLRMFSCVYQTMRGGRIFYCPDGKVINTQSVNMDYVLYRKISDKGCNIGIRYENEMYVALTLLVAKAKNPTEYICKDNLKVVKGLQIIDVDTGQCVDNIVYEDVNEMEPFLE